MLPRKNGKIYATRTLTNCLRFNKRLDMNFLVRKVQEVDILNPLCVSIVEIFESRAMNALVFFFFFRFFSGFCGSLSFFASSFPGGSAAQKSSSGGKFSLLSFLSLVATHTTTTTQKRPNGTPNARAFSVAANNNSTGVCPSFVEKKKKKEGIRCRKRSQVSKRCTSCAFTCVKRPNTRKGREISS